MEYKMRLYAPKSTTPTYILFDCTDCVDGERCSFSIGEKVLPSGWDDVRQITFEKSKANVKLAKIAQRMHLIQFSNMSMTKDELKNDILETIGMLKKKQKSELGFFDMWDAIVADRLTGKELFKGRRFSESTIINYRTTKKMLETYFSGKRKLNLATFSIKDFHDLLNHLTLESEYNMNTIGGHMIIFKTFLAAAFARGWHQNIVFRHPEFKGRTRIADNIAISMDELAVLDQMQVKGNLETARAFIIIGAFTSLRISDMERLKEFNIVQNTITISAEKTNEPVLVPIHPYLKNVIERHNGWPAPIELTVLNDNIKKLCKLSGMFDDKVLWIEWRKGVKEETYPQRWELFSSHTGRRSFVTNFLDMGGSTADLMKLTGIKSEKTVMRYNKATQAKVATRAAKMPFFNLVEENTI